MTVHFAEHPFHTMMLPSSKLAMIRARVIKKDPVAIYFIGEKYRDGMMGLRKDLRKALELFTQAAELGSNDALCHLGVAYQCGKGVQEDKAKAVHFWSKAAMQGHVESRHNLGMSEGKKGSYDRAAKHFLISAKMGDEDSLEMFKKYYMAGGATREQYTEALKGYQDAVEGTKSHDRDEAKRIGY